MSTLSEVYDIIDGLKKRGLAIDASLRQEADEHEQEYIKTTVVPALQKTLTNLFMPLKSDFVLVCEHSSDNPLSVILSRETELASLLDDALILSSESTPSEGSDTDNDINEDIDEADAEFDSAISIRKRTKSVGFTVTFDDGFKRSGSIA